MTRAPSSLKKFVVAPATRICSGWPPCSEIGVRLAPNVAARSSNAAVDWSCRSRKSGGENVQSLTFRARSPHDDETRRVRVRKRTKQNRIHDTENRRAGSDAERDRDRRDGRKPDVLAQPARGVGQVSEQRIHRCVLGMGPWGLGDLGTWGLGDSGPWGLGDSG